MEKQQAHHGRQVPRWRGFEGDFTGPLSMAPDISAATLAILPIGATEQHGRHLPVSMDSIVATEIAMGVGRATGAYVLPTIPMGTSMEHRGGLGTVWFTPSTLRLIVRDIAQSLSQGGINALAVITGHGGNFILGPTVRELNTEFPTRSVLLVPERIQNGPDQDPDELHVGSQEMSLGCHLLGLDAPGPDADFVPEAHRDDLNRRPLLELSPTGVWGHPSRASSEQGARELAERVDRVTAYIRTQFDELFPGGSHSPSDPPGPSRVGGAEQPEG